MLIERVLETLAVQCWRFAAKCDDDDMAVQARRLAEELAGFLDHVVGIMPETDR